MSQHRVLVSVLLVSVIGQGVGKMRGRIPGDGVAR